MYLSWINGPMTFSHSKVQWWLFFSRIPGEHCFFRKTIILWYKYPHTRNRYFIRKKSQEWKQRVFSALWMRTTSWRWQSLNISRGLNHHGRQPFSIALRGRWRCRRCFGDQVPPPSLDSLPPALADLQQPVSASLCLRAFLITEGSQVCQGIHTTQKQHQPTTSNWQDLVYKYPRPSPSAG